MECPTPCVCGRIVELHEMESIANDLPNGGNLVCIECYCDICGGSGQCGTCGGSGKCDCCGQDCSKCDEGNCLNCHGKGYRISKDY